MIVCSSSSSLQAVKFTANMTINKVIPKNLNVLIVAKLVIIYVYKLLYHYVRCR